MVLAENIYKRALKHALAYKKYESVHIYTHIEVRYECDIEYYLG